MKYILILVLFPATLLAQYTLPADRTPNGTTGGWVDGSNLWNGGTLPNYTGVSCPSCVCDGTTDDTAHINAALSGLSSGQALVLPTNVSCLVNGIVRLPSNTVLRGTGTANVAPWLPAGHSGKTRIILGTGGRLDTQNFSFSGSIYPTTSYQTLPTTCTISGTPLKGDTTFTNSSTDTSCALSAGMYISVYGNDDPSLISTTGEDGWCGYCGLNDGFYAAQQIVKVVSATGGSPAGGNGATVTITPGWYLTPFISTATVSGNGGVGTQTEPAGAKYTIINFTTTKAGYEDLVVDASVNDIGANPIIRLQGCLFCWVKDVETYMTGSNSESAHVKMEVDYGNEVRDSYLHDQRSGASGSGYGVYQEWTNSDNKIENNVIRHSRHGLLMQGGGSGDAFLYNYVDDMYTDDLTYFGSLRSSHGGHPFMNLFEGNIFSHWVADEFIGSSSHTTGFRNWIRGGEPNFNLGSGTIPSFPPNTGYNAVDIYAGQSKYSTVDSILGNNSSFPTLDNWSAATLTGYNRSSVNTAPLVYSIDTATFTYGTATIASSASTFVCQGNYDFKTVGLSPSCGSVNTYANSMYYATKPSFVGTCAWPGQGSDLTTKGTLQQAAYMRATSGACSGGAPVATPTFSPTPTGYGSSQTVSLATATTGATICYTTNGTTPTTNGAGSCLPGTSLYSSPFLITSTTTVKAIGTLSGSTDSAIASGTYTINGAAAAPAFSPIAGTYGPTQSVVISSTTSGSTICYTTDGSTPTANGAGTCTHGTTYSTAVSVASSLTLQAIASKSGWNDSTVASASYVINGAAGTPTFSPVAGSYGPTQNVILSTSTSGATICYTTSGATPTSSSPGVCAAGSTQYVSAVSVATSLTLKAIATKAGFSDSSVGSAAYTINGAAANVTFSPIGGSYGPAQTVTLSTVTGSAVICYTTDGSTPTATTPGTCSHGTTYSTAITVATSETITALATKSAFVNSSVTASSYIINGTLATPTFNPVAGPYGSTQSVAISSSSTIMASMTETSNANDIAGNAPHRNTYTNCATGYSGGSLQPTGVPVGQLYCTAADKTAALANGGPNNGVVTSTISGTGTSALSNGQNAGGVDSATSVTATYAGTTGTGCGVGATFTSNLFPGLTLPGEATNASAVFGLTTGSNGNTSMLSVSKYNTNGDGGNNLERIDCASANTTSVSGQHYEWDSNYNTSGGSYMGFGMDYNFATSKIRACFQNCSGWTDMELCPTTGGSCVTTYSWPAGDYLFSERHDYWDAGCTYSGSNCAHYGQICLQLWNAGSPVNSLTCYNIQSAATHTQISATPINKTTWTHPQYGPQHQWDVNATSATLTANVAFDSMVAFAPAATICYTIDGSTPTTDGAGNCTHGTAYTGLISVATSLTIKAIATEAGFTDSAVGTATYTINGTAATPTFSPVAGTYTSAQSVTITSTTPSSTIYYTTDGSTPTTSSTVYSTPVSIGVTTTLKAIATASGFTNSAVASGLYTINLPAPTVQVQIAGTVKFSGNARIQ